MSSLSYIGTFTTPDPEAITSLSDLVFARSPTGLLHLYAASIAGETITTWNITATGLDLQQVRGYPSSYSGGSYGTTTVTLGSTPYIVMESATALGEVPAFFLTNTGNTQNVGFRLDMTGLNGALSDIETVDLGDETFLFAAEFGSDILGTYRVVDDQTLVASRPIGRPAGGGSDISDMVSIDTGAADLLLTLSATDHRLTSFLVGANGNLTMMASIGAAEGLGLGAPSTLKHLHIDGRDFVVVGASMSSSLSVIEVSPPGGLAAMDHVVDGLGTRFAGVTALEVAQTDDGRAYVLAAGSDDGITLFQLLPTGRLLLLDVQEDLAGLSLDAVSTVAMRAEDAKLLIYVGSQTEAGITAFSVDVGAAGLLERAGPAGIVAPGGAGNDILIGDGRANLLSGGSGNDTLITGGGLDTLSGGDGADTFVLSEADGARVVIEDFQPGFDMIDLSAWGWLRATSQLSYLGQSGGALLNFAGQSLRLYSADGGILTLSDVLSGIDLSLQHLPTGSWLTGEVLDAQVSGGLLTGTAGNDVLKSGAGADTFDGGGGDDTVSYENSFSSLRVDMLFPHINTNIATGDTFLNVENLEGSQGRDNLRGTFDDNHISGMRNVDFLFGRRGDDTLDGGVGDDVLFGGPGADILIGGENRDRAQYSESLEGLVIDLADSSRNTGEAAGDVYLSIEDIAGTEHADTIAGNSQDNRLFGRNGADNIHGQAGDDYLNAGGGRDTLDGGAGDDVLRGGPSADTFVFNSGHDVIEDFWLDTLQIDGAILWGGTRTAGQVITDFASISGANVVFDFGDHSLTLQGVGDIAILDGVLTIL